jgi:hypothetical protein
MMGSKQRLKRRRIAPQRAVRLADLRQQLCAARKTLSQACKTVAASAGTLRAMRPTTSFRLAAVAPQLLCVTTVLLRRSLRPAKRSANWIRAECRHAEGGDVIAVNTRAQPCAPVDVQR